MQAQIFLEVMSLSDIRTEQEGMKSTLAQIQEGQERQVLLAALEKLLTKHEGQQKGGMAVQWSRLFRELKLLRLAVSIVESVRPLRIHLGHQGKDDPGNSHRG